MSRQAHLLPLRHVSTPAMGMAVPAARAKAKKQSLV